MYILCPTNVHTLSGLSKHIPLSQTLFPLFSILSYPLHFSSPLSSLNHFPNQTKVRILKKIIILFDWSYQISLNFLTYHKFESFSEATQCHSICVCVFVCLFVCCLFLQNDKNLQAESLRDDSPCDLNGIRLKNILFS